MNFAIHVISVPVVFLLGAYFGWQFRGMKK